MLEVQGAPEALAGPAWALQHVSEVSSSTEEGFRDSLAGLIVQTMMRPSPDLGWMFPGGKPEGAEWPDNKEIRLRCIDPEKVWPLGADRRAPYDVRVETHSWPLAACLQGGPDKRSTRSILANRVTTVALAQRSALKRKFLGEWYPIAVSLEMQQRADLVRGPNPKADLATYGSLDPAHPDRPSEQMQTFQRLQQKWLVQTTVWVEWTQRVPFDMLADKPHLSTMAAFIRTRDPEHLPARMQEDRRIAERAHRAFYDSFFVDGDPRGEVAVETVPLGPARKAKAAK